ncbi:MAG TPA: LPS export ABC transporter ATP-binding protein [Gemmataceae bacterium]|jgi:lipopolysaccharide export system ATP-binding protein|nr:LPS export ABC transporter ATP-binding protein [Gemmataceae bacterium]
MAILEVRGLVKYYGRRKVVDGVDFDVDVGEVVGLLGPNGAGKTTSFRMTTGQITPNEGKVLFNGQDVSQLPMYKRARLGMGYLAQETSVFRKLSVEQNILAILEAQPFYRSLGRKLTKAERHQHTDRVLEQFGLSHLRKNNAARLSGGEKRRLEIARCLVCDPLLILLDEPFTGIDPQTITDIQQIVRDLRQQGIGILITDHRVREILMVTERSYLIKGGKVRTHGTPQQIIHDPIAISEYLGSSFSDDPLSQAARSPSTAITAPPAETIHHVVEQEKVHRLIDRLRTGDNAAAAAELVQRGAAVIPTLLEALERRDVEMRRQAFDVLQRLLHGGAAFDPFAPEAQRRQQLALLREQLERKAG